MNTLRSIFAGAALLALPAEAQDQHHWIETDDPAPESAYTYIKVQADVSVTIRDIGRPLQRRLVTRLKRKTSATVFGNQGAATSLSDWRAARTASSNWDLRNLGCFLPKCAGNH